MNILIAGGSGLLGSALTNSLRADGHLVWVLTRKPKKVSLPEGVQALGWDGRTVGNWLETFSRMDAVVNLVGETVGQWPWTAQRKLAMRNSRIEAGTALTSAFQQAVRRPPVLIQGSGIGYYGPCGDQAIDENSPAGSDFFSALAVDWEASTAPVELLGVRRAIIRTSLVLAAEAGILPLMALPVKYFAGGRLGNGQQGISWIHIEDHVRAVRFLIANEKASGVFNLTAPNPLSNADFISILAHTLRRPNWIPAPAFALRLVLGEMSTLLLDGQYAIPRRLVDLDFPFHFETLTAAFNDIF